MRDTLDIGRQLYQQLSGDTSEIASATLCPRGVRALYFHHTVFVPDRPSDEALRTLGSAYLSAPRKKLDSLNMLLACNNLPPVSVSED